jgi:hypothetical protein
MRLLRKRGEAVFLWEGLSFNLGLDMGFVGGGDQSSILEGSYVQS